MEYTEHLSEYMEFAYAEKKRADSSGDKGRRYEKLS